jgi:hypothetical protein
MKKLLALCVFLLSLSAFAAPQLESGAYGVQVRDRRGNIHHCTLNIENNTAAEFLVLNINDCPPPVIDVRLYKYDGGTSYMSDKIYVTTRRGGYKMYEIIPMSTSKFKMISYREYGDGGVGKPREVVATLK